MTDTIRGPQLPAYEVDTLAWIAGCLTGNALRGGAQVSAEIVTGESAILLRFPSGGERFLYLDDRPHPDGVPVSFIEAERLRGELEAAEGDRDSAHEVIRAARELLERIESASDHLPEWLRDNATGWLTMQDKL